MATNQIHVYIIKVVAATDTHIIQTMEAKLVHLKMKTMVAEAFRQWHKLITRIYNGTKLSYLKKWN